MTMFGIGQTSFSLEGGVSIHGSEWNGWQGGSEAALQKQDLIDQIPS